MANIEVPTFSGAEYTRPGRISQYMAYRLLSGYVQSLIGTYPDPAQTAPRTSYERIVDMLTDPSAKRKVEAQAHLQAENGLVEASRVMWLPRRPDDELVFDFSLKVPGADRTFTYTANSDNKFVRYVHQTPEEEMEVVSRYASAPSPWHERMIGTAIADEHAVAEAQGTNALKVGVGEMRVVIGSLATAEPVRR